MIELNWIEFTWEGNHDQKRVVPQLQNRFVMSTSILSG